MPSSGELLNWKYDNYLDYKSYWPVNRVLKPSDKAVLAKWRQFQQAVHKIGLLGTSAQDSPLALVTGVQGVENLLTCYRAYTASGARVYFIVSFQTLITFVNPNLVIQQASGQYQVMFDLKNVYTSRKNPGNVYLENNQILLVSA
ncbi:unnamed protein product [Protopolystoma xenopodis]|uniref:Uncharacterized protein n=1 Tax=Protopolystoma xenopodis TaxID=117903 RepID=A0A448WAE8_9PLAT|nr:unnamed protein product [Protopolystoma xenopodis]